MPITTKRIYDAVAADDGARFLVDRLWPRGVSKERAGLQAWLRDISPSNALRAEYHGATAQSDAAWQAFVAAYHAELDGGGEVVEDGVAQIRDALSTGPVTLLYAAKDDAHNNAVALLLWLQSRGVA